MTACSTHFVLLPGLVCTEELFAEQIASLRGDVTISVADHTRHDTMSGIAQTVLAKATQPICAVWPLHGRFHRFRDDAPGTRPYRTPRSPGFIRAFRHPTEWRLQLIAMAQTGGFKSVRDNLWPLFVHPARHDDVMLKRAVFNMKDDTGPKTFIRQEKAIMSRSDSRLSLGAIHCPTLMLVGNEDALTPVSAARMIAEGIVGSKIDIVQDCRHLSTTEWQDAVIEALRAWIAR